MHSFFLRMYQTVDLATPNVVAICRNIYGAACIFKLSIKTGLCQNEINIRAYISPNYSVLYVI